MGREKASGAIVRSRLTEYFLAAVMRRTIEER
jgi:hypothetical protein